MGRIERSVDREGDGCWLDGVLQLKLPEQKGIQEGLALCQQSMMTLSHEFISTKIPGAVFCILDAENSLMFWGIPFGIIGILPSSSQYIFVIKETPIAYFI